MQTEDISLVKFIDLYIDMLGIVHGGNDRSPAIIGVHPQLGLLTYQEQCPYTGAGILIRHGAAPYVRRAGELTAAERERSERAPCMS